MRDQRLVAGALRDGCRRLRARRQQRRFQRINVIWKGGKLGVHASQ
jgi:hypothetical protein